jgi:hypothetical protein
LASSVAEIEIVKFETAAAPTITWIRLLQGDK